MDRYLRAMDVYHWLSLALADAATENLGPGTGSGAMRRAASRVEALYRRLPDSGLNWRAPSVAEILAAAGPGPDGFL